MIRVWPTLVPSFMQSISLQTTAPVLCGDSRPTGATPQTSALRLMRLSWSICRSGPRLRLYTSLLVRPRKLVCFRIGRDGLKSQTCPPLHYGGSVPGRSLQLTKGRNNSNTCASAVLRNMRLRLRSGIQFHAIGAEVVNLNSLHGTSTNFPNTFAATRSCSACGASTSA